MTAMAENKTEAVLTSFTSQLPLSKFSSETLETLTVTMDRQSNIDNGNGQIIMTKYNDNDYDNTMKMKMTITQCFLCKTDDYANVQNKEAL